MENPWKSQKHIHNMFHDFPLKTANIHCRVWLLEGSQSSTIQYIIMSWQLQARPSSAVKLRHHPYLSCPRSHAQSGIHFPSYHTILQSFGSIKIYNHLNHQCHHCIFFQAHVFFPTAIETTRKQQQKQHQLPWDAGNHKIPETPGHLWDFPWKTNEMTGCINTIHVQSIEIRQISIDHWGSEHGLQYIYRVWNCIIMYIYIILQYPKMSILIVTMMINTHNEHHSNNKCPLNIQHCSPWWSPK